jgi:diguanylate cyclase (GGDEF)-like protein
MVPSEDRASPVKLIGERRDYVERTIAERDGVNEQLLRKVLSCSKLPSLPAVAVQVIELTSDKDVTMNQLAQVIENDQGLTAKVLKTVNSSFYGLSKECSKLAHAQTLLGLNAIKTLALGFSLVSSLKTDEDTGFDYLSYWRRSMYTAVGAKAISTKVRSGDVEEAFLGGLLQDIGMIAMSVALGKEYDELVGSCGDDHRALMKKEYEEYELQHPLIGAMLAERWRLPESLVMPIKYHERPTSAPLACRNIVRSVALGGLVADILMQEDQAYWLSRYYRRANEWFSLTATEADEMLDRVNEDAEEVADLFDIHLGTKTDKAAIVEQASERLAAIALEENQHAREAVADQEEARRFLEVDMLTGLGVRQMFVDRVEMEFERAKEGSHPFSVVLLDVDSFRKVNDELGSEIGDVVLVRLAQWLKDLLEPDGIEPYRFGGEEFAVALPGMDRKEAATLAERVRKSLSNTSLDVGARACSTEHQEDRSVHLTMSIGVATFEGAPGGPFLRAERLIHAADDAVHAAKEAGGDRVLVFTPRKKAA